MLPEMLSIKSIGLCVHWVWMITPDAFAPRAWQGLSLAIALEAVRGPWEGSMFPFARSVEIMTAFSRSRNNRQEELG